MVIVGCCIEFVENGNYGVVVCNPNTKVRLNGRTMHHNHWGLFAVEHAVVVVDLYCWSCVIQIQK